MAHWKREEGGQSLMEAIALKDLYLTSYTQGENDPKWLKTLRQQALGDFSTTGFPTQKGEAWKYTDLSTSLLKHSFGFEVEKNTKTAIATQLKAKGFNVEKNHLVVFVNGFFSKELSSLKALGKGVKLQSLTES